MEQQGSALWDWQRQADCLAFTKRRQGLLPVERRLQSARYTEEPDDPHGIGLGGIRIRDAIPYGQQYVYTTSGKVQVTGVGCTDFLQWIPR